MRLLLDTHTFLWMAMAPDELSSRARDAVADIANERLVSIASIWEMHLKQQTGKLVMADPAPRWAARALPRLQASILSITLEHLLEASRHPLTKNHKDPFDRLLVAQAIAEGCHLVTKDRKLEDYGVEVIW